MTIGIYSGIVQKEIDFCRKKTYKRKEERESTRLGQQIARTSNEIYQKTQNRKATANENELFNELNKLIEGADETTWMLKQYKESWFKKLMYKKIKLQKLIKISR